MTPNSPMEPEVKRFRLACVITRVAFMLALFGYAILGAALFMFSGFMSRREGLEISLWMLCGGIYIIGSLFAIGDKLSAKMLVVVGVLLNLHGVLFWAPSWGSGELHLAVIGLVLSMLWLLCILLKTQKLER